MKTIKELDKKFKEHKDDNDDWGYREALKDVLKLIDELRYNQGDSNHPDIVSKELKARILG